MKRLVALLLAGAFTVLGTAHAYDWSGVKWDVPRGGGIPYVVSNELSADVPDRDALEAIQIGYDVWTALPCSYMAWNYNGRTANNAWGAADGENVATWREAAWNDSPTALGIASWSTGFGGSIGNCDVKFNGEHHSWAHFNESPGGFDGRTDIGSVAAHEAGHCIGLGHSDVAGSTMWPSTGPGDTSGRSLGADDIAGACEIYPSGGDVPDPDDDAPPPPGMAEFGEDCSMTRCAAMLFCVSDGRESYCSRACEPGSDACGDGFYCANLSQGGGACARGEDPAADRAGFGEDCSQRACEAGLICVNDEGQAYCTGECINGNCPTDWFCAELQNGGSVCARGEPGQGGQLPGPGDPCSDRGLCQQGYFCLNDALNVDEDTGEVIPYCTTDCDDGQCEEGFRCVPLQPQGTACQIIPGPGSRALGEDCWVNPERPFERPTCGDGLICVEFRIEDQQVVDKGFCTKNCAQDDCCPNGWGCLEVTPVIGQCREGRDDDPGFECMGERPDPNGNDRDIDTDENLDAGAGDAGGFNRADGEGDSGGCAVGVERAGPWGLGLLVLLLGGVLRRRR